MKEGFLRGNGWTSISPSNDSLDECKIDVQVATPRIAIP